MVYKMIFIAGIALLLIATVVNQSEAVKINALKDPIMEKSEEEAFQKLLKIENDTKSGIENLIKKALPMMISQSSELDLSGECMGSLLKLISGIKDMKLWAFQMVDSTGIPTGGVLRGKPSAFGSYQQCLEVVIPQKAQKKESPKTGKYCLISLKPPLPPRAGRQDVFQPVFKRINATFKTELMNFVTKKYFFMGYDMGVRIGVCVPSSCNEDEVNKMIGLTASNAGINAAVDSCEVKEGFKINKIQIMILAILSSFILVCLVSTIIIEVKAHHRGNIAYSHEQNSYSYRFILAFSIVANFKSLMKTRPSEKRSLDCIYGIRYISCTWVILGHAYCLYDIHMFREMINLESTLGDYFMAPIFNAILSVDSFIFITSTLLSYIIVKNYDLKKTSHFPVIALVHRLIRLLPGILLITGLIFLMPFLTSGPDYREVVDALMENCEKYWWTNVVFVGNFLPMTDMCLGHLWYISVDMQLYLVSMVYFLILFRKKIYGKIFLIVCVIASIVVSGTVTYVMNYPPTSIVKYANIDFIKEYIRLVYVQPHVHLGVYSVGLFLGTFLARNPKVKLSRWPSIVGWIVAFASGVAVIYAVTPWNDKGVYTLVESVAYSATHKTAWAVCLAWVVLASFAGKGGYVNKLMSWPGFQPLVKLTYLIYLIHLLVIVWFYHSRQGQIDFSHSTLVFSFFGIFCTSHILAVIFRLFFEAPCIEIERIFLTWVFSKILNRENQKNAINNPELSMVKFSDNKIENEGEKRAINNGNGTAIVF